MFPQRCWLAVLRLIWLCKTILRTQHSIWLAARCVHSLTYQCWAFELSSTVWKYCYFEKTLKAICEEYLLCDRCLFCVKGHETSALLILEKITDRNLINATNAALQTYVSAGSVFERWVLGVHLAHKEEYFSDSDFFFKLIEFKLLIGIKSWTNLELKGCCAHTYSSRCFFFLVGE